MTSLMLTGCASGQAAGTTVAQEETTAAQEETAAVGEETTAALEETAAVEEETTSAEENGSEKNKTSGKKGEHSGKPGEGTPGESRGGAPGGKGGQDGKGARDGKGGPGGAPGGMPGGAPGQSAADITFTAVKEVTKDTAITGETVDSTGTDENAVLVNGDVKAEITKSAITRNSADSTGGDSASFYGVGAAVLGKAGTTYIKDCTIETDAKGGAGVFAYGDGVVYIADTDISTKKSTSGGIHAAGGGTLYAWNVTAETDGESSAAIRSDRGGGTMVVDGGSYTSNGSGSPAIYSTADIAVHDADLIANGSEAVCIEGHNSIYLYDCDLTGNMSDDSRNEVTWNVILYQSMSGDSEVGNSTFSMDGGTLTAKNGGMFYTTNTESTFILRDVDIRYAAENDFFLRVTGNENERGWGETGANGARCTFTAIDQDMAGDVQWDSVSTLDFYMTEGSTLTGAFVNDESTAGEGGDGYANLTMTKDSTWTVTADSRLTSLSSEGTIIGADGESVTIRGTDGTVYAEGDGKYTVTVDSYGEKADVSGVSELTGWEKFEVERPAELN